MLICCTARTNRNRLSLWTEIFYAVYRCFSISCYFDIVHWYFSCVSHCIIYCMITY